MILRESEKTAILSSLVPLHDGVIVWETFKQVTDDYSDEVSTKEALGSSCTAFGLGSNYDCSANIPVIQTNLEKELWFLH